jgi:phosphomannomutase
MLKNLEIDAFETRVGRVYIINEMRRTKADIGGEISSHFYFKDDKLHGRCFLCLSSNDKNLKKGEKKNERIARGISRISERKI